MRYYKYVYYLFDGFFRFLAVTFRLRSCLLFLLLALFLLFYLGFRRAEKIHKITKAIKTGTFFSLENSLLIVDRSSSQADINQIRRHSGKFSIRLTIFYLSLADSIFLSLFFFPLDWSSFSVHLDSGISTLRSI